MNLHLPQNRKFHTCLAQTRSRKKLLSPSQLSDFLKCRHLPECESDYSESSVVTLSSSLKAVSLCPAATWFKGHDPAATSMAPVNPPPTLAPLQPIRSRGVSATMVSFCPVRDMTTVHSGNYSHTPPLRHASVLSFVNTSSIYFLSVPCLSGALYPPISLLHQALSCQQRRE